MGYSCRLTRPRQAPVTRPSGDCRGSGRRTEGRRRSGAVGCLCANPDKMLFKCATSLTGWRKMGWKWTNAERRSVRRYCNTPLWFMKGWASCPTIYLHTDIFLLKLQHWQKLDRHDGKNVPLPAKSYLSVLWSSDWRHLSFFFLSQFRKKIHQRENEDPTEENQSPLT